MKDEMHQLVRIEQSSFGNHSEYYDIFVFYPTTTNRLSKITVRCLTGKILKTNRRGKSKLAQEVKFNTEKEMRKWVQERIHRQTKRRYVYEYDDDELSILDELM
jgi:hypothetical protein